eukprot:m.35945 g.35945  ORF g.35945 m.35945 type:complete len:264 (+) comp32188_c0_seq8:1968-2759(+)
MTTFRVFVRDDGLRYEGEWSGNDEMTGLGRGQFADGSYYEGDWKAGLPDGYGVFSSSSGSKFSGQWKEERLEGRAVMVNRSKGQKYEGDYREGKSHGFGILSWTTGDKYAGEWVRDSYDGLGIFSSADGQKRQGRWRSDELVDGDEDATGAVSKAEKAAKEATLAVERAEETSSRALDAAEMARRYQADMDDAELQQAKQEGRAYYALYNYEARSAEEVSLEENDTIVDAEAVDDIWFRGRNQRTGQAGLIPLEYVERLTQDE